MNNYQTWLETPDVVRIALVHVQPLVSGALTTMYLSTHAVQVDGVDYLPIIAGDVSIAESISVDYSATINYGDISVANNSGQYDSWLNDIWVNKSIKIYVGELPAPDTSPTITDFELVFDGLVSDIDCKDRNVLSLKLRDKLEKLNTSISEVLLGNYYQGTVLSDNAATQNQYKNNLKPLCFGEVHNVTPMLSDSSLLEYMVNLEAVELIIEVRDNGVPVAFTTTAITGPAIPAGSFRLLKAPAGTITCSVQGIKRTVNIAAATTDLTYTNSGSNTISTILKHFGQQLDYTDLDSKSFSGLGTQAIGMHITERANVLSTCQAIAKSCGLVLSVTRTGKIKLVTLGAPEFSKFSASSKDTGPQGMHFSPDGSRMYIVGTSSDAVNQYSLATAWDVTTAVYVNKFSILAQDTSSAQVTFNSTGTKMFVLGNTADAVFQYSLSTPWSVTTATYLNSVSILAADATASGMFLSNDGLKLFIVGTTSDRVHKYTLSTAWDTSTAVYSNYISIATQDGTATGVTFNTDGTYMYIIGSSLDSVYQYKLGTAWDQTSAIYEKSFRIAYEEATPSDLAFSSDGSVLYIVGSTSDNVYQYPLTTPWDIGSIVVAIRDSDIMLNSLTLAQKVPVQAGVKLGYAKNWTIQNSLLTAIPQEHKDMYATEYLESTPQVDSTIKDNYYITVEPELEATYLIDKTEADAVALKKLNLFKQPRKVFSMRCTAKYLSMQVGDRVVLYLSRFNLSTGVTGQVVSTKPNWLRGFIEIEVLV